MISDSVESEYKDFTFKKIHIMIIISILTVLMILISLTMGSADISILEIISVFLGSGEYTHEQILWRIRAPRVISALLAGVALAVSGTAMQSILRNPMGSPFTLGISQAASFGVAFAIIILGAGSVQSSSSDAVLINNPYLVTLVAFASCMISTGAILLLIQFRKPTSETLVLIGIMLGSFFNAATSALEYFADDVQLASIIFFLFGDLSRSDWKKSFILAIVIIPATLYFIKNSFNYNALNSGDETAYSLGVNANTLRIRGMIIASLTTAVTVSFFGIIAFIGLVVPHIVRRLVGTDERFLIPASALFGGFFLLLSDTIARTIIAPVVLPVGILTSFIGAPLFLYLLLRKRGPVL